MKKLIIILTILFTSGQCFSQAKDTLTNETIIQLTQIGLQPDVIIMKIKNSHTKFDVNTNSLIALTNNKVPSQVIGEMIKAANDRNDLNQIAVISKSPDVMHPAGIYYYNASDTSMPLRRIDAAPASFTSGGGGYGGFGGGSSAAVISGEESTLKIATHAPVFYLYFNEGSSRAQDWMSASTPKEFALVQFDVKRGNRSFKTGSNGSHGFSSSSREGIPDKFKEPFDYVQIAEGIYKIVFNKPIAKGEYCFVMETNIRKVYDFKILK